MLFLLITRYVGPAWRRPRGPPHGGTNSHSSESGVNTSSLTDEPLHYINVALMESRGRRGEAARTELTDGVNRHPQQSTKVEKWMVFQ